MTWLDLIIYDTGSAREGQWIKKIVINTTIDHIHSLEARCSTHINDVILNQEITAFNKLNAHMTRQKSMFKIGGIIHTRSKQNDNGFATAGRSQRMQGI